jgi:hypothetical protein
MDIAAFKVSLSVVPDIDATTLQAEKARSASIGAMDEISQKVQNANTHILRRHNHEHAPRNRGQFKGQFKVQKASAPPVPDLSIRWCWSASPRLQRKRRRHHPASRESKVSLHWGGGTLHMWVRFAKSSPTATTHIAKVSIPVGQWMKVQGKFKM